VSAMHFKTLQNVKIISTLSLGIAIFLAILLIVKQTFFLVYICLCLLIISLGGEALLFYHARMYPHSTKTALHGIIILFIFIFLLLFR